MKVNNQGHSMRNALSKMRKAAKAKIMMLMAMVMIISASMYSMVFATPTTAPAQIDEGTFTTVTNGAKSVLGLFSEFPINVFLACSIVMIAISVIKKIKKPN